MTGATRHLFHFSHARSEPHRPALGQNVVRIANSSDPALLKRVDALDRRKLHRGRSEIFQIALSEQLERLNEDALHRECAKLDPAEERTFADAGLSTGLAEWPPY